MIQQSYQKDDLVSRFVIKAKSRYAILSVNVLQPSIRVIRNTFGAVLAGFHAFVESAEKQRSPQNKYWWDSSETVRYLF